MKLVMRFFCLSLLLVAVVFVSTTAHASALLSAISVVSFSLTASNGTIVWTDGPNDVNTGEAFSPFGNEEWNQALPCGTASVQWASASGCVVDFSALSGTGNVSIPGNQGIRQTFAVTEQSIWGFFEVIGSGPQEVTFSGTDSYFLSLTTDGTDIVDFSSTAAWVYGIFPSQIVLANIVSFQGGAESISESGNLYLNESVTVNSGQMYEFAINALTQTAAYNAPEPSTLLMASSGALAIFGVLRRRLV